jgi:hypothetical protein
MPRVRLVESLIGEDGQDWHSGETHEASNDFACYLVGRGAAVVVDGVLSAAPLTTQAFDAPDPVAAHRDPIGPKRTKKR